MLVDAVEFLFPKNSKMDFHSRTWNATAKSVSQTFIVKAVFPPLFVRGCCLSWLNFYNKVDMNVGIEEFGAQWKGIFTRVGRDGKRA